MQGILSFERPTRYHRIEALKEVLILGRIEQRLFADIRRMEHAQLVANGAAGPDVDLFNDMIGKANTSYGEFRALVAPYLGTGNKDYTAMWEEYFGMKIGSPEYDRMIEQHEKSLAVHQGAEQRSSQ